MRKLAAILALCMKLRTIITVGTALVAALAVFGGSAQATVQSAIKVQTPDGFLSPVMQVYGGQTFSSPSVPGGTVTVSSQCSLGGNSYPCYLPNPNVPIPVVTRYVDDSHATVALGTSNGLALVGSLDAPVPASTTCPGGGQFLVAVQSVGGTVDPDGSIAIAEAYLPAGTADLTGVVLQPMQPGGTILTNAQVTALGWWDDDGLDVGLIDCNATPGTIFDDLGRVDLTNWHWATSLVGAATYAPVASAGGDPWMKFHSVFKAETHLIVRRLSGKLVRDKDLGWLAAGNHEAHFKCGTLTGTMYVHVYGVAKDKAAQKSPVRKVTC